MTKSRLTSALLSICVLATACTVAHSQLLIDEFDGTNGSFINQKNWRLAFGGDGSFFGRTQLKTNLATDYPVQNGTGAATLRLETYLDDGMGGSSGVFSGHEINTKRNFARAGGLSFEARARLSTLPPGIGGLVGGMFLFDVTRTNGDGLLVRDEIDHEMLSNEVVSGAQRNFTNYWNDGPFSGVGSGGSPQFNSPAGFDMTQFHDYRVDWLPNRIDWYVDDNLVRTTSVNVPDDPMNFRINLWAPDAGFTEAYDAALMPAATAGANQTYELEIDRVQIDRLNTMASENLILDPSFDDPSVPYINLSDGGGPYDETQTGTWFSFNNASFDAQIARTGSFSAKTFGTFTNGGASGFFQNVDAVEGDVFEASVFAQTITDDSISPFPNYATIALDFYDDSGNNLNENGKSSIILEGRDPNTPIDEWVNGAVDAVAPAGTDQVRMSLFFIQEANDPGAIWFDDVSLQRLTFDAGVMPCDFDSSGVCDIDDIDALTMAVAMMSGDLSFDLNGDEMVNAGDIAEWLVQAGADPANAAQTAGNAFLAGDFNLDGFVDGQDFIIWNGEKFTSTGKWSLGDANGDGFTDGPDFIIWNGNKFTSSTDAVSAVPEPGSLVLLGMAVAFFGLRRRG